MGQGLNVAHGAARAHASIHRLSWLLPPTPACTHACTFATQCNAAARTCGCDAGPGCAAVQLSTGKYAHVTTRARARAHTHTHQVYEFAREMQALDVLLYNFISLLDSRLGLQNLSTAKCGFVSLV